MPELPEVEIVRRNLDRWWTRPASEVCLLDAEVLKHGSEAKLRELLGSAVPRIERRGKYLIFRFPGDGAVVTHFRMTGKIVQCDEPDVRFARLAWDSGVDGWLVFKDSRRLGLVAVFDDGVVDDWEPLRTMGPEPLGLTGAELAERLPRKRRLKAALLDQKVIAGVGNIAVSEVFWRLGLHPEASTADLDQTTIDDLAATLSDYLEQLVDLQLADEVAYLGEGGEVDNPFDAYGREGEPCRRCDTPIERTVVSGRSSYFCPTCQR